MTRFSQHAAANLFQRTLTVLAFLSAFAASSAAFADVIGINFVGGNQNSGDTLTSTQSAGVVAQTHWNNLTGSNSNNTADAVTIVNNLGVAPATPVTVSWTNGAGNYDNSTTSGQAPLSTNGNQILNNGGIWGNGTGSPTVTVSNIPYTSYEVIVTSLLDHGGTIISTTLGSSTVYANQTQNPKDAGYIDGTSTGFTYTRSTDTTGVGTTLGDYAMFTNLHGSSFTVSESIVSGNASNANLSSIQIVNLTPEPSSFILCGLGAAGLFVAARRRAGNRRNAFKLFASLAAVCLIVGLSAPAATAGTLGTIGINFSGGPDHGTPGPLAATDVAGVVAQANWNNEGTKSGGPASLVNSAGGAVPATVSWSSGNTWSNGDNVTYSGPNNVLLSNYLDGGSGGAASVTISNIPYPKYDLYIYTQRDGGTTSDYTVNGVTQTVNVAGSGFYNTNGFVLDTATQTGDYLVFRDLTASTVNLLASQVNTRSPVDGIQIVSTTPEPSSFILCGLGAAGLFVAARRRRRA